MAEVVAAIATIQTLLGATSSVLMVCCDFIGRVHGAPADIRSIKDQVSIFQSELQSLHCFLTTHPHDDGFIRELLKPDSVLYRSQDTIQEILELLGPRATDGDLNGSPRSPCLERLRQRLQDLKWPGKQQKAHELLTKLEAYKNSLAVALSAGLAKDMQVVKAGMQVVEVGVQHIRDEIQKTNDSLHHIDKKAMLKWLCPQGDSMRNMHGEKRNLQEPDTCAWMTREDAWKQWLDGQKDPTGYRRFIWIHGIPGAGKTVLASYLVEEAAKFCEALGYAYYYCLHSRAQDETAPFLRWIINLLSRQARNREARCLIPTKLRAAYEADRPLSTQDLLDCLAEISLQFDRVYIIVDAVDESQSRDVLLRTLSEIGTSERFDKVSLLFTSREENDIMEMVRCNQDFCHEISMSNKNVRDDIKSFIHAELERGHAWRRWDKAFLDDIEDRLVQEARGMFRWAVCQLDVLKNQRSKEGILEGLRTLPKDIFATYERILTNIPERDREFARTALALICSNTSEIPTAEILVAACLCNVPYIDIGNYTVETLREICGCLIHLSKLRNTPAFHFTRVVGDKNFHQVALAHYTVKEYLFFPGTAQGPAKFFALSDRIVRHTHLAVFFKALRHFGIRRPDTANGPISRYEEYCLNMTENALKCRRAPILRDDALRGAVLDSLAPDFQHLAYLRQQRGTVTVMRNRFPLWNSLLGWEAWPIDCKATGTLANLVILDWLDMAEKYLESSGIREMRRIEAAKIWTNSFKLKNELRETLFGLCLRKRAQDFLHLFVHFGATFNNESEILYTAINEFYDGDANGRRTHNVLRLLLWACASPNPVPSNSDGQTGRPVQRQGSSGFSFTPLQYAVYNLEQEWVDTLLEEGADANGVGTRDGVVPYTFRESDPNRVKQLCCMGQESPLEICATTVPSWASKCPNPELVRKARQNIEERLKRYGAREYSRDDGDEMVIDLTDDTYDNSDAAGSFEALAAVQTID